MSTRPKIRVASVINGKYLAFRKLGEGGCGVIYEVAMVKCPQKRFACKAETTVPEEDPTLPMEKTVIELLNKTKSKHVVHLFEKGKFENYSYIVMTLLGPSLDKIRSTIPVKRFSTYTSLVVIVQALDTLKEIHEIGYVHRDVKPPNFAIGALGTPKQRLLHVLDFGIARRYVKKDMAGNKKIRMPRRIVPFRGTLRYCSIGTQDRKEQGRHDDLWSLFYMLVEFIKGTLPWSGVSDEGQVKAIKADTKELFNGLDSEYILFAKHLTTLHYKAKPDYGFLRNLLLSVFIRRKFNADMKVDWEKGGRYDRYFEMKTQMLPCVTEQDMNEVNLSEILNVPENMKKFTEADLINVEKEDDDDLLNTAQDDTISETEEEPNRSTLRKSIKSMKSVKNRFTSKSPMTGNVRKYAYKPKIKAKTEEQAIAVEEQWKNKQAKEYANKMAKMAEAQRRASRDVVVPDGCSRERADEQ